MRVDDAIFVNYIPISLGDIEGSDIAVNFTPEQNEGNNEAIMTRGTIGGWTLSNSELSSGGILINANNEQILLGVATGPLTGVGIFLGKDGTDYEFRAGNPAGAYIHWDGSTLTQTGGVIISPGTGTDISLLELTHDLVFSVTDADTIAWASGTITLSNGETFSIGASNTDTRLTAASLTSPMNALTYLYLNPDVSTTEP